MPVFHIIFLIQMFHMMSTTYINNKTYHLCIDKVDFDDSKKI